MTKTETSIFVSAGEVSGDHYIARVFARLRAKGYAGRIYGLCGAESRNAGVEALWSNERLHVIGFAEVLGSLWDILQLKNEIFHSIMRTRPEAVVLVDSPDFHMPLIRQLRRGGYTGRIFYISPPAVWAWRSYRVRALAALVDECLPLFQFEHDYLEQNGCNSLWIGHPMVEEFSGWRPDPAEVLQEISGKNGEIHGDSLVAMLPGSRGSEIDQLYPVLTNVYDALAARGYSPVFSVAPGLSARARAALLLRLDAAGQARYEGPGHNLMALSRLVVGSSGTATAQALLLQRYMVVLYKVRPFSALLAQLLLSRVHFAVPNLLAGKMLYPELIQNDMTSANAIGAALEWLELDDDSRAEKEAQIRALLVKMGQSGVYDFWAGRILGAVR